MSADHDARRVTANTYAAAAGFDRFDLPHRTLPIVGFQKERHYDQLVVLIEGDGTSWASRRKASTDPTPRKFVGLKIAAQIKNAHVIYLGRPCQYVTQIVLSDCDTAHWTNGRFRPEIVDLYADLVRSLANIHPAKHIKIAGYSGGGVIAALVAAKHSGPISLTTIAAPLDVQRWIDHHGVSPLSSSINPMSHLTVLCTVPQEHFLGALDTIVPVETLDGYREQMMKCNLDAGYTVIADQDHDCCWTSPNNAMLTQLGSRQAWAGEE